MQKNSKLLQVIDGETGEIVKEALMQWDEDFYIKKGTQNISHVGVFTPKEYVRSFPIQRVLPFFRKHPELYFYSRVLAEALVPDSGILRRVSEPYKWRHFAQDINCDHTTCYRIRAKLVAYGIVGEVKVFGTKHLCLNPYIFGKGSRVLKQVADYFRVKGIAIYGKSNEQTNTVR